jgi:hypothetical protein
MEDLVDWLFMRKRRIIIFKRSLTLIPIYCIYTLYMGSTETRAQVEYVSVINHNPPLFRVRIHNEVMW